MDIIYCAGGNKKLAKIAIEEGFLYGARSDDIRDIRCNGLIDINWEKYNWEKHLNHISIHKPKYAVVPDITNENLIDSVLEQARKVQCICPNVIIVPKIHGITKYFPSTMIVGISVPTSYAGFLPEINEISQRKVHLLGGTPRQQRELWKYYKEMDVNIVSLDCNSHSKTSDFGSYWNGIKWCHQGESFMGKYETFRMSCKGIMKMWESLGAINL